ncbi:MAG TPA: SDR family oxidoreductase [Acidimicrobiales bacterium]|nr:SDR family oxidoreductase [Acidimicrobiales bacterium]
MEVAVDGRTALVTGASRGIGLAIAHRLVESGARVVISSRKQENLDQAMDTFSSSARDRVLAVVAHVGSREDAWRVVGRAVEHFGSLDILVNNAGTNPYFGPLVDIDQARLQKTFEVNQASVVLHTAAAWHQYMARHGGVVLNIASVGGLGPEPGLGWYNVTKAAVIHLTKQFAYELAPTVRVNAIAPGLVRTELARELWLEHEEQIRAHIPLGRLGEPDDVASVALILVSGVTSWVTGQTVVVDGGTTNQPSGGVS